MAGAYGRAFYKPATQPDKVRTKTLSTIDSASQDKPGRGATCMCRVSHDVSDFAVQKSARSAMEADNVSAFTT